MEGNTTPCKMVYSITVESSVSAEQAWRPGESVQEAKPPTKPIFYCILLLLTMFANIQQRNKWAWGRDRCSGQLLPKPFLPGHVLSASWLLWGVALVVWDFLSFEENVFQDATWFGVEYCYSWGIDLSPARAYGVESLLQRGSLREMILENQFVFLAWTWLSKLLSLLSLRTLTYLGKCLPSCQEREGRGSLILT